MKNSRDICPEQNGFEFDIVTDKKKWHRHATYLRGAFGRIN